MENFFRTDLVEKYLQENKLSKKEFCKKNNIKLRDFEKITTHNYNVDVTIIFKIAKVMNINVLQLLTPPINNKKHE